MNLKEHILTIPDFPKPGIYFKDISPLLADPLALNKVSEDFIKLINLEQVDYFVGLESRGFIFAAHLAAKANKGFIPFRKKGKLPPPVQMVSYDLEYGTATLEAKKGTGRIIIVDDVLATGGTIEAAIELATKCGYQVVDLLFLIDLQFLNTFKFNNQAPKSLIQYK